MGSKGQSSQTQTTTPAGAGYVQTALDKAQGAASQPFNIPQAPVAGFSQDQQSAFKTVNNAQGMAQPYINQAQQYFSPQGAQDFLNPYAANVMAGMQNVFGQQNSQNTQQLTQAAGGVGADRIGVGQANLANQQGLAAGTTLSGLYGNAVQQAQSAGYGTAALGSQAQNAALTGAQAQLATGGLQQQLQQAQLNAPYQQQLAQSAFPYQQAQFLAGITGSLAPGLGSTTSGTSQAAQPSIWSQILGAGTAAAGVYGQTGGFGSKGSGNAAYGGNGVWGGSSANPLPGLDASDYGTGYAGGGPIVTKPVANDNEAPRFSGKGPAGANDNDKKYDEGGTVSDKPIDISQQSIIPKEELHPIQMQTPQLNFSQPQSGGGAGDAIGSIAKMAMMFANRGGRTPYDGGGVVDVDSQISPDMGFAEGGDTDAAWNPDEPFRMPDKGAVDNWRAGVDAFSGDDTPAATPVTARKPAGKPIIVPPAAAKESAAPYAAPAADPEDPNPPETDFAKSPWAALTAAGFGMMGGTSPYAGVNIGQGGLQGVKTLESMRAASQRDETIAQASKRLAQEAKFHEDQFSRETMGQKLQREQADRPYDEMTAAQKATEERAAKVHEDQYTRLTPSQKAADELARRKQDLEEMKPVQVGQDDYGRPIMARRNPKTGEYEIINRTTPTAPEAPVGPGASAAPAAGAPADDAVLPANATPTQGLAPNGTFANETTQSGLNEDALQGMKTSDANKVRAIAAGKQKFLPLTRNNAYNRYIMDKVSEYDPNAEEGAFSRRSRTANFFAVGTQGGGGQNIASMNTFGQHADELMKLSKELDLGQYSDLNSITNALARKGYTSKQIQDKLGEWEVAQKAVADEGAKVFAGSNSALADREAWGHMFDASNPRSVTESKLKEVVKLIAGRLNSLTNQYNEGMRTSHAPTDFIAPRTREIFDNITKGKITADMPKDKPAASTAAPAAVPAAAPAAPQIGETRTNAHGVTGKWNGTGWEVVQ